MNRNWHKIFTQSSIVIICKIPWDLFVISSMFAHFRGPLLLFTKSRIYQKYVFLKKSTSNRWQHIFLKYCPTVNYITGFLNIFVWNIKFRSTPARMLAWYILFWNWNITISGTSNPFVCSLSERSFVIAFTFLLLIGQQPWPRDSVPWAPHFRSSDVHVWGWQSGCCWTAGLNSDSYWVMMKALHRSSYCPKCSLLW